MKKRGIQADGAGLATGPIKRSEIIRWILINLLVTMVGLAAVLGVFRPELELLAEEGDMTIRTGVDFASIALLALIVFWATYRKLRCEKARRL
jgi:hypothetical protein